MKTQYACLVLELMILASGLGAPARSWAQSASDTSGAGAAKSLPNLSSQIVGPTAQTQSISASTKAARPNDYYPRGGVEGVIQLSAGSAAVVETNQRVLVSCEDSGGYGGRTNYPEDPSLPKCEIEYYTGGWNAVYYVKRTVKETYSSSTGQYGPNFDSFDKASEFLQKLRNARQCR